MRRIKRIVFSAVMLFMLCIPWTAYAQSPLYAEDLNEGTYSISVKSSSSMFRIVNCELKVAGEKMTAEMTLSGKGYEKLFMGTGEEALSASDDSCIYFKENSDGKYTYTVPVEALDKSIDCAAWSIKKQKWYDRELVFQSETLPDGAVKGGFSIMVVVITAVLLVAAAAFALITVKVRKK